MNCAMYMYTLLVLTTIVFAQRENYHLIRINDTCTLPSGKLGKCVLKEHCKVEKSQQQNQTDFKPCGFVVDLLNPGVCCHYGPRKSGEISRKICEERYMDRTIPPEKIRLIVGGGGYDAKAKEYPHMAALGFGEWKNIEWACGGSLISDQFVLTAAHCISTSIGRLKFVRLGDLNLRRYDDDADPQDFTVLETFVHPDYKPPSKYNDIALVKLDRPFEPTSEGNFIAPACLHTEHEIKDRNWTATGWGVTSLWSEGADHLQVVELYEYNDTICQNTFSSIGKNRLLKGVVNEKQLCAGHKMMDTCLGDSGGPLQMKNRNYKTGHTIIGITSFGKPCTLTGSPGVYTRVSHYIEWIESIVWPQ